MKKIIGIFALTVFAVEAIAADSLATYDLKTRDWSAPRSLRKHDTIKVHVKNANTFKYKVGITVENVTVFSDVPSSFSASLPGVAEKPAGTSPSDAQTRATCVQESLEALTALADRIQVIGAANDDKDIASTLLINEMKSVQGKFAACNIVVQKPEDLSAETRGTWISFAWQALAAEAQKLHELGGGVADRVKDLITNKKSYDDKFLRGSQDANKVFTGAYLETWEGPVVVSGDEVRIGVAINPLKGSDIQEAETKKDSPIESAHIQIPVEFGLFEDIKADFSTGVVYSSLVNASFATTPVASSNPQTYTITPGAAEDFSFTTSAILHLNIYKRAGWSFGPAVGVGVDKDNPRYLVGFSLAFGREQRLSLDFGEAFGRVQRLDGVAVGDTISTTTIPMRSVFRGRPYFGISYNFSSK